MRWLTVCVLVVLFAVSVLAQHKKTDAITTRTSEASASIGKKKKGLLQYRFTNQRYLVEFEYGGADLLMRETVTRETDASTECCDSTVKVQAWDVDDKGFTKEKWSFEHDGDEGKISEVGPFYQVHKAGCCGDYDYDWYFNLSDGKLVYASTGGLVRLRVEHTDLRRFVTYEEDFGQGEAEDATWVGVLRYGDEHKTIQEITIEAHERWGELTWESKENPEERDLLVRKPDGPVTPAAVTNCRLRVKFQSNPVEFYIPVENDRLAIEKATLPEGIRVIPAQPSQK